MQFRLFLASCLVAFGLAGGAKAQTPIQVINGATCVPYPAFNSSNAVPYAFWLYGFRQSAFCHITMSEDRRAIDLNYALVVGSTNAGGVIRLRLCMFTANGFTRTCGNERTITASSIGVAVLPTPGVPPTSTQGAYISVRFPDGIVSTIQNIVPVWTP